MSASWARAIPGFPPRCIWPSGACAAAAGHGRDPHGGVVPLGQRQHAVPGAVAVHGGAHHKHGALCAIQRIADTRLGPNSRFIDFCKASGVSFASGLVPRLASPALENALSVSFAVAIEGIAQETAHLVTDRLVAAGQRGHVVYSVDGGQAWTQASVQAAMATLEELEDLLIQADLGVETAMRVTGALSSERYGKDVTGEDVTRIMASEIVKVLAVLSKATRISSVGESSYKPALFKAS